MAGSAQFAGCPTDMMIMADQIFLLANMIITVAYASIMVAIVVPLARAGQLRTNKLAVATSLIVVGTRGRTGLARLALGSVAEAVINRAPCSVLVVPLHPA